MVYLLYCLLNFVVDVENYENWQCDVSGEEIGDILFFGEEDLEVVGQSQDDQEYEYDLGGVGLKWCVVREDVEYVVLDYSFVEVDVGVQSDDLGDEVGDGGDIWKKVCQKMIF